MSRSSCRLCLSEDEFNISLFGSFCRRNNMIEKIKTCLNIVIKRNDKFETICYKCAENVQNYHNFIEIVKEAQKSVDSCDSNDKTNRKSYVPKFFDMDDTFSFRDVDDNVDKKMPSSPLFSFFSPPDAPVKKTPNNKWKTRIHCGNVVSPDLTRENCVAKTPKRKQCSKDLFDSQSQELEVDPKLQDSKGSTGNNVIKKIRQMCYMHVDF